MDETQQKNDQKTDSEPLIIGGWHFDKSRHCIERNGNSVRLEPKTAQLLSFMSQYPGKSLSREQLFQSVWPDVIVSDEVLTNAVNKIRRAFSDDRKNPQIVETIPKVGYRLIAPVKKDTLEKNFNHNEKVQEYELTKSPENSDLKHQPSKLSESSLVSEEILPRKFAFILHADVEGSSKLVQMDEQLAHERIQNTFKKLSDEIESSRGVVKEIRGDALLALFNRASDAIEAAISFQSKNAKRNKELSGLIRPVLRIGISMGEVVEAKNTVTGTGVILAQRLEQIADAGSVIIQGAIRDAVPSRLPFKYIDLGYQELKGFDEKTSVYEVFSAFPEKALSSNKVDKYKPKSFAARSVDSYFIKAFFLIVVVGIIWFLNKEINHELFIPKNTASLTKEVPSLVILPFKNISKEAEHDYLADGITEDIITDLSRISNLLVISSSASSIYKDKETSPKEIGEELQVDYILQGSIRIIKDVLRVNAQLIETQTGFNKWGERYDRSINDIFVIQDELSKSIVQTLNLNLSDNERKGLSLISTINLKAYDHFQEGQKLSKIQTKESNLQAQEAYRVAIETDSGYGRAYGALAYLLAISFRRGWTDNPTETIDRALQLALTGIKLDATTPQTHWSLGFVYLMRNEHENADKTISKAIEMAPGYADAYGLKALISNNLGKPKIAIEYAEKGMRLNPFYSWDYLYNLGRAHYTLGGYLEAIDMLEQARDRNVNVQVIRQFLAASYVKAGQLDDAEWEIDQMLAFNPDLTIRHIEKTLPLVDQKLLNSFLQDLRDAGMPE